MWLIEGRNLHENGRPESSTCTRPKDSFKILETLRVIDAQYFESRKIDCCREKKTRKIRAESGSLVEILRDRLTRKISPNNHQPIAENSRERNLGSPNCVKSGKYLETILHARLILRNDDLSIKIGHDTSLFTILSNRSLKKIQKRCTISSKIPHTGTPHSLEHKRSRSVRARDRANTERERNLGGWSKRSGGEKKWNGWTARRFPIRGKICSPPQSEGKGERNSGELHLARSRADRPARGKKSERQFEWQFPSTRHQAGCIVRSGAQRVVHSHTSGSTRKTLSSREQTRWAEKLAAQVSNRNESAMVSGVWVSLPVCEEGWRGGPRKARAEPRTGL